MWWVHTHVCMHTHTHVHTYIYTHHGTLLNLKKNEILALGQQGWTREYYAQWNESDREGQIPYDFISYVKSNKQNKWINKE